MTPGDSLGHPDYLFVYGTLRREGGHAMGAWLAARADWHGRARLAAARLYRVGWYPAVVRGNEGEGVSGELYQLRAPGDTWPVLDEFEGVRGTAADEYRRQPEWIRLADGRNVRAWVYWYRWPVEALEWMPGGDWLAP